MDKILIYRFLKFGIVGLSGVVIDFSVTWLLKEKLKANKYLANSIGFIVAASSNYIWNRIWTFESQNTHITTEYFSFLGISVMGLLLNNLMLYFLSEKLRWNFYLSKLFAIGGVTIWNFVMNYLYTF
ncbi:MAG: GtrA family protein [Capnocytophaga sp.]|nr:GtrA family protein [Capnocytophaga sp.]